jgi:cyclic pyranopterin phosphate synthase
MTQKLTHLDETGRVKMVDVSQKDVSTRVAIARGEVRMKINTLNAIEQGLIKKGDVLTTAQIAGIMAAKRTFELIPLCHPLPIMDIKVDLDIDQELPGIQITSTVKADAKTGVEMEALTATAIAALTVYDMAKAVEKTMCIQNIRLVKKSGGSSGDILNE